MIESVAVDNPVLASTMNQVIDNVNSSPGRAVFTANGSWTVPSGVHKFKVTMCGGGGRGGEGYSYFGGESGGGGTWNGGPGGDSPMISAVIAGQAVGATFAVTVGAAGHGALGSPPNTAAGSSSFGSLMSVAGGGVGGNAAMSTEGSKGRSEERRVG